MSCDPPIAEADVHRVGFRIGAFDFPTSDLALYVNLLDDSALGVVKPAQKGTRSEQTSQTAIREGR